MSAVVGSAGLAEWEVAEAGEIRFVEDFALAPDRAVPLKQLIPGTEDYYYYHCLHLQHTEQFDKVPELLTAWTQRFGETQRVWQVRTRQALLTYDRNGKDSLDFLRRRLGLNFNHRKEELNPELKLPTALDPALISRARFITQANLNANDQLSGYEDSAIEWLQSEELPPLRRRSLLARLTRPDFPGLAKLVAADLAHANSGGFGSHPIHKQMLRAQLDELLALRPELKNQQNFVHAYLTKLHPHVEEAFRHDRAAMKAYLDRLWSAVQGLDPVHNALKAHVLYQRLVLDRLGGEYDKERFLTYLKLPRHVGYIAKAFRESENFRRFACDLNANFDPVTMLPVVGDDEPLVRSYLSHFLLDAAKTEEFEPYINDIYLKHLFAEVKIVNGLGDSEQWASLLPPAQFQALKERVDIDFAFTNKTQFTADAPVSLDLHIKNVSKLIVKVFEINTQTYYRATGREIDTDINLDGLVANHEQTFTYTDAALRRLPRKFDFPQLGKPGVYIIDFIGNGRSSRALVRKGRLKHLVKTMPAGQAFTVLNEANQPVKEASVWVAGHEYRAGDDGRVLVPFSTNPGRQSVVLIAPIPGGTGSRAAYAALDHFQHEGENYEFAAGFYVDRESLLERKKATVFIRPSMTMNGNPVSIKLLEDVKLLITATDLDGIASTQVVNDALLFEDRETVHEFQVPARCASLAFQLAGQVKRMVDNSKIALQAGSQFSLNGIEKTEKVEDLFLLKANGQYALELRGRSGETRASRPISLALKHRDFRNPANVGLMTDVAGRVSLGDLPGIVSVTANGPEGTSHTWRLPVDEHAYSGSLHGKTGDTLTIPYLGSLGTADRSELSLLELRGGTYLADRFSHIAVKNGLVSITGLPVGDYELYLKWAAQRVQVRVTAGETLSGFHVGANRQLETKLLAPVQISGTVAEKETLRIQLRNVSKFTRVHVYASRYLPEYSAFREFSRVRGPEPYVFSQTAAPSVYLTGRNIGDEYRYIIERKQAVKFPGVMLDRPSLLLNPWAVRETHTGEQVAQGGDDFRGTGQKPTSATGRAPSAPPAHDPTAGNFSTYDFLANASLVLANLVPNELGIVELKRAELAGRQFVVAVAVDPIHTTVRTVSLPEEQPKILDRRLLTAFDPASHYTQQKQISVVPVGQKFTLHDITTSKFEAYDSLSRVFTLYSTLRPDPKLSEFAFILNWPKLKDEEKRSLYSKHASHELSFFLFKKDPAFFKEVIRPYLENKKDKTFLDEFLLERDLASYLEPWKFAQLNVVERVLLASRLKGEGPRTARHLADLAALIPPNLEEFNVFFDTSVKGGALETDDAFGLSRERSTKLGLVLADSDAKGQVRLAAPAEAAAAPRPGAAPAMGGAMPNNMASRFRATEVAKADKLEAMEKRSDVARDGAARFKQADKKAKEAGESKDRSNLREEEQVYELQKKLREEVRQLYRKLEKTKEWAENNYHHLTIDQQHAGLVTVNAFWKDFAAAAPGTPFYTKNLAAASRNFTEAMFALSVLDLPFESPKHDSKFDGVSMTITPGGPLVVFHAEVRKAAAPDGATKVLVSQNFFRHGDRHRTENGEQVDKFITDEFLVHTPYGCQIVVTNPTSARQKLSLLVQIPEGSIPLLNAQRTRTVAISLEPYHTQTLEYHFYFPAAGKYHHFPVHVAKNEALIAAASSMAMNVVTKPTKIDTDSWDYISQHGTIEEVYAHLDKHNVHALNLDKIAWRMRDPAVFKEVTSRLALRHAYSHTLWSYALQHDIPAIARQFLLHADNIINDCGGRLESPLLTVDLVARRVYEHLEYKPLVNARTHALGKRRKIVNDRLEWQYHRFLTELSFTKKLTDDDLLAVTYYLLLQDRVEEALPTFQRVSIDRVSTKMQYDYCAAYIDFFSDEHSNARAIATKYAKHPVDRWRNTFATILAQLDEAEGKTTGVVDPMSRNQQQEALAATEPNFEFTVEAKQVKVTYQNLKKVRINFYEMDVELLFSRNPFVQKFDGEFASIQPNHTQEVTLPDGQAAHGIEVPKGLQNRNILVEIVGAGKTRTQAYYSHSLNVQVIENYGQVRVTEQQSGKPVPKAYVKVYAQSNDGTVKFYKDGYTDLRGRFDYASLSTDDLESATKFSVLILSDTHGAIVREATPPKR